MPMPSGNGSDGALLHGVGHAGTRWLIPVLLISLYVAQCLWFVGTQSLTYDEPVHVLAGLNAWRHHQFDLWNDQPPLGRLLVTLPIVGRRWQLSTVPQPLSGNFWTISIRPDPQRLARRTRPVNIALGVTLACLLWFAARRMFSEGGANLSLALFAFSPPLIAHFSVATVDGTLTLLLFATAVAVHAWRITPSWPSTIGLGLVLGLAIIAKFSALPLAALAFVLMIATRSARQRFAKVAAALVVGSAVVWSAYFLQTGDVNFRGGRLSGAYARGRVVVLPLSRRFDKTLKLPAPDYFAALAGVVQHNVRGQPAFFLGETRRWFGWRLYLPVVMLLKWPPLVLALATTALVLVFNRGVAASDPWEMVLFPATFLGLALLSNVDIGDRYILPVYPFLLLWAARVWNTLKDRQWAVAAALVIIAAQSADCLRYAPDYLSYFTPFISPSRSRELLTDSNLDWGQGLIALQHYQHDHGDAKIWLAYYGSVDPREYGISAWPMHETDRPSGTIVVSATQLSGQYLRNPGAYHWLFNYPLKTVLNHSLYVFEVPDGHAP